MIKCPACTAQYGAENISCPVCNFIPQKTRGFTTWAPDLAFCNSGYKSEIYDALINFEKKNFWYRSRNKIILWAIKKYLPNFRSFMEVGCGTGFVLSGISNQYPSALFVGSDIHVHGLSYASKRAQSATFVQLDATSMPYVEEFDVIGCFDVLEHIKEDELVLKNICTALRPNGGLIITVPQHKFLWSALDVSACHERRYSAQEITQKIHNAGFEIVRSTSFVSFLFPIMFLSRLSMRHKNTLNQNVQYDVSKEVNIAPWANKLLEIVQDIEKFFIKCGFNFPIGGSRLIIATKKTII